MSQRTPIWPYVLVLGCLFALALIAPRGWDHFAADDGAQPTAASQGATTPPPFDPDPQLVDDLENNPFAVRAFRKNAQAAHDQAERQRRS